MTPAERLRARARVRMASIALALSVLAMIAWGAWVGLSPPIG